MHDETIVNKWKQEDRCIVFPNFYQHRVAPFQLKNPNEIGQRKILIFFLVDPSIRILSTANVPPQQAKEHRKKLKFEGNFFIKQNNELFFERPFSLCEH